jgi:hypothetical protein
MAGWAFMHSGHGGAGCFHTAGPRQFAACLPCMSNLDDTTEPVRAVTAATPKFEVGDRVFVEAQRVPGEQPQPRLPGIVVKVDEHEPDSYAEAVGIPPFYEVEVPQPVYQLHRESELTLDDGSELTAAEQVEALLAAVEKARDILGANRGKTLGVKSLRELKSALDQALAPSTS